MKIKALLKTYSSHIQLSRLSSLNSYEKNISRLNLDDRPSNIHISKWESLNALAVYFPPTDLWSPIVVKDSNINLLLISAEYEVAVVVVTVQFLKALGLIIAAIPRIHRYQIQCFWVPMHKIQIVFEGIKLETSKRGVAFEALGPQQLPCFRSFGNYGCDRGKR